jgi:type I restriction enzyme M protein
VNLDLNWIANFIWGIADDVLRDLYVRGKYRDVILPMTVLRRLDAVLEPKKRRFWTRRLIWTKRKLPTRTWHCGPPLDRASTTPRNSRCATCAAGGASNN